MNAREIYDIVANLKTVLGFEGDEFDLSNLAAYLEKIVMASQFLDKGIVSNFESSKQRDGRFKICAKDNELITNIKALINVLVSMQNADVPHLLNAFKESVADEKGKLTRIRQLGVLGVGAFSKREELLQFHKDVSAFNFYIKNISRLLPSLPALDASVLQEIQKFRGALRKLPFHQALRVINVELEEARQKKLDQLVPTIDMNAILNAIDGYGLKDNIDALAEMTAQRVAIDHKDYDKYRDRFISSNKASQQAYNACRDIKALLVQAKFLALKIVEHPLYNFPDARWGDIGEEARAYYISLNESLKEIDGELEDLAYICKQDEELSKVWHRNARYYSEQKETLHQWVSGAASNAINNLSIAVQDALQAFNVLVESCITPKIKKKYFQYDRGLYKVSAEKAENLNEAQINAMLLHNVSVHTQGILQRLQAIKTKPFPSNVVRLMEVLTEVGELVSDVKRLTTSALQSNVVAAMKTNLELVFTHVMELFYKMLIVTHESELKLGLRQEVLLEKLEGASEKIHHLAGVLGIYFRVPNKPFYVEKAITRMIEAAEQRVDLMKAIQKLFLKSDKLTIFEMLSLVDNLEKLKIYEAHELCELLKETVNKMIGMDLLEDKIKSCEESVMQAVKQQELITSYALMNASSGVIHAMLLSEGVKKDLSTLRVLYHLRAQQLSMIDAIQRNGFKNSSSIRLRYFSNDVSRFEPTYGLLHGLNYAVPKVDVVQVKAVLAVIREFQTQENSVLERMENKLDDIGYSIRDKKSDLEASQRVIENLSQSLTSSLNSSSEKFFSARSFREDSQLSLIFSAASIKLDTRQFIAAQSKESPISVVATTVFELDDHDMVRNLIEKNKGEIVLQSERARKNLIENALRVLSDEQKTEFAQSRITLAGYYNVDTQDKMLTVAVKRIYNTMLAFEDVMFYVNKLQAILAGGYWGYRKLPDLLATIYRAVKFLLENVEHTNQVLLSLRDHVAQYPLHANVLSPFTMIAGVVQQLPMQLQMINSYFQFKVEGDDSIVSTVKKLGDKSIVLKSTSKEFIQSLTNGVREELTQSVQLNQSVSAAIRQDQTIQRILIALQELLPSIKNIRQHAKQSEEALGLRANSLLANIDQSMDQFSDLIASYGVDVKGAEVSRLLSGGESESLGEVFVAAPEQSAEESEEGLLRALIPEEKNKKLNERKIRALLIACVDYKHHLAEALYSELGRAYPEKDFDIDLKQNFELRPGLNVESNDVLKKTIEKYNAVDALQKVLKSPLGNTTQKLEAFSTKLDANRALFAENRDTAGMIFLKVVATIFSLGLAALFGIWRTQGQEVTQDMAFILMGYRPQNRVL